MSTLRYGVGGVSELPTPIEQAVLEETPPIPATGTVGVTSPNVTALSSLAGVAIGDLVVSPDFAPGTTVLALADPAHTATFSTPSLDGAGASTFLFSHPIEAGKPLDNAIVVLFTNVLAGNKAHAIGDLVEPTYQGYARSGPVVWGDPFYNATGYVAETGDKKQFLCTGGVVSSVILGAALVDPGFTKLLQLDIFLPGQSVTLGILGDALDYVPLNSFVPFAQS